MVRAHSKGKFLGSGDLLSPVCEDKIGNRSIQAGIVIANAGHGIGGIKLLVYFSVLLANYQLVNICYSFHGYKFLAL